MRPNTQGCNFHTDPGLFAKPVEDWEQFYHDVKAWRARTDTIILRNKGLEEGIKRFRNVDEMKSYPHQPPEGSRRTVDEFYTQFLNLKDIAEEVTQEVSPLRPRQVRVAIRRAVDESAAMHTGKAEIIKQLSAFAEEGDLLLRRGTGMKSDWPKAKEWAERADAYIRENIGEDAAAWFSLSTTEAWPGLAVDRRYVDWLHTRKQRLGQLASEVRAH